MASRTNTAMSISAFLRMSASFGKCAARTAACGRRTARRTSVGFPHHGRSRKRPPAGPLRLGVSLHELPPRHNRREAVADLKTLTATDRSAAWSGLGRFGADQWGPRRWSATQAAQQVRLLGQRRARLLRDELRREVENLVGKGLELRQIGARLAGFLVGERAVQAVLQDPSGVVAA